MMWRARRLKEIAEANQPAFVSTSGTHWWLAEPQSKHEAQQSVPAAPAKAVSESKPDEYFIAMSSALGAATDPTRDAAASAPENGAADSLKDTPQQSTLFTRPAAAREEHLTWDAKSCSFVAC
jgi:hypothetical protein